jgi:hypothetical protein
MPVNSEAEHLATQATYSAGPQHQVPFPRTEPRLNRYAPKVALAGGTLLCLGVLGLLLQPRGGNARVTAAPIPQTAADTEAPADARYQRALQAGLAHDYRASYRQFRQLAAAERGTNTGAWSVYQASLAAEALKDAAGRDAELAELRRQYPVHRLTLRLAPEAAPSPSQRPAAECGPRALLYLCQQAALPATLAELRERCGTDAHGTTLAKLEEAARSRGFRTSAVRADAAFLRRAGSAGIAWVNGDHYVAFEPAPGKDRISLTDPNGEATRVVSAAELAKSSQGILLFLAWGDRALPK